MSILLILLAFGLVFFSIYHIICHAEHFFKNNKKTPPHLSASEMLPDDGGAEYIQNYNQFMKQDYDS